MSHDSTQASSVESPPSTSATSVSTLLESASGCIHLAEYIQAGKDKKEAFLKGLVHARKRFQKTDESQSPTLQYHCLQCTEAGGGSEIETHCMSTKHAFSFCAQAAAIYCAQCRDIIYDKMTRKADTTVASSTSITSKKRRSSEANGDDSYISANSAQRPCGREGVRGLFNLGHTCYMNAVVQTMVHNSLLSSFFLGKGHPVHTCTKNEDGEEDVPCVACGFTEVFSESRVAENTQPMAALSLLKASWLAIPVINTYLSHLSHH